MKTSMLSEWMLAHRKLVISFLILCFAVLLFLRFYVFPETTSGGKIDWNAQWVTILDGMISTVVVSFVLAVTLWWTKPPLERIPPGFEILPGTISKTLEASAANSTEWEYVGHTARYVRNRIFPILASQASRSNRHIRLRLLVLDLRNTELCKNYADYRNQSRSGHLFRNEWTTDDVKAQILVTLLKVSELHHESNYIACEVRLRGFLSQFRMDAPYDQLTVTQEDPQEPAYQYPRGSRFYNYYKRENHLIWDQSDDCEMGALAGFRDLDISQRIDLIAKSLGMDLADGAVKEKALNFLRSDRSPYA